MRESRVQRVVVQPQVSRGIGRGIDQIVEALRPTLGPLSRTVAIDSGLRRGAPELLDDGGIIVRRISEIADRDADMGAMLLREGLWKLHQTAGDGIATSAVLFQSVYNEGLRYITAGGNAMILRGFLEEGMRIILNTLKDMAVRVEGKERLAHVAESICHDPPLAKMLGEVFDIIGEYGRLEIREGHTRDLEREYVEGMYWDKPILSRRMFTDQGKMRADLENVAILISDFTVDDTKVLMRFIQRILDAGVSSLMMIARTYTPEALATLVRAGESLNQFQVVAVQTPGDLHHDQVAALQDLSILTGGFAFTEAAGHKLGTVAPERLGHARKVWADRFYFGIIGGKGHARGLRQHISDLRHLFERTENQQAREKLQERIGKLMGGSAILHVGAFSELDIDRRKELAERTARAVRGAIGQGVVPGAGVALQLCRPRLRDVIESAATVDERAAYRILIDALDVPARTIISNAGYSPGQTMAEVEVGGSYHGFDARTGKVVDVREAGIWDPVGVQVEAVKNAISGAALALTVDVLIHHKKRERVLKP